MRMTGKRKMNGKVHLGRPMLITVALILLIVSVSFAATRRINQREEANAFQRLHEEAGTLARELELQKQNDQEQLQTIASVICEYEDLSSPRVKNILASYSSLSTMSRLELLLPDNTVIRPEGANVDADGILSFEEEAALGSHITDREEDLSGDEYILRHFVPVIRDGETIAMLYGVIELGSLPNTLMNSPYGGKAAIYIIDGNTGDFLMDTWHKEPGNIWALGERPMAPGYDHEILKQGLIDGKTGYVVFVSETTGEYLYFYYAPLAINSWRIALSVPEDIVFSDARAIERILNVFLLLEVICFILYFLWMLRYVRHETNEKQHQLDTINYIYDVEKLLFNAHEQHDNIILALEKIAHITSAQAVSFLVSGRDESPSVFTWESDRTDQGSPASARIEEITLILPQYFRRERGPIPICGIDPLRSVFPSLKTEGVRNLTAIPIRDTDSSVLGILTAFNMPDEETADPFLKNAAFSFSLLCRNMRSYNAIREKGEKDVLSGLYNRNRYERDLPAYPDLFRQSLACIYVDVNGLHELNNSEGHEAGDRMLRAVSARLLDGFGEQHSYRIGGDEFLAFAIDMDEADLQNRVDAMRSALEKEGFHISVGVQRIKKAASKEQSPDGLSTGSPSAEDLSMEKLVKAAEHKMYLEKKAYYETAEHDRRQSR